MDAAGLTSHGVEVETGGLGMGGREGGLGGGGLNGDCDMNNEEEG